MEGFCCAVCRFWDGDIATDDPAHGDLTLGACRRYAPHVVTGTGSEEPERAVFPLTLGLDWCAEGLPRPPKSESGS